MIARRAPAARRDQMRGEAAGSRRRLHRERATEPAAVYARVPAREFERRVLSAVRRIPPGRVATYGDIAALAGTPRAARAVGNVMRRCGDSATPCHRVVAAGGALGGYGGHPSMKRALLRAEGVEVGARRIVGFHSVRWRLEAPRDARRNG